ncbi:unnamed protein product [Phytophthora fragariaefolia]|uniref:Unnamed protein product n=1 Tax=Phytophthora fragariaefolia TaxID=1490495 RepID=A0A9W6UCU4_9STRA|nr:unnamed protein product [Phytophthora fragariaefolia]
MTTKKAEVLLGSGNYFHWEYNMRTTLARKGLLAHVEAVKAENEITEAWLVKDAKALGIIAQGVEIPHQTKIRSATRAMQAWNTLREYYNRTTLHNRVAMTKRLLEFKMEDGSSMAKHLDAFDEVLLKEHERLQKKETTERAFKANAGRFKGGRGNGRKGNGPRKNGGGFKGKCFTCNQVGHVKRDCPERNGGSAGDAVFAVSEERLAGWLIDSGATSHMMPHRGGLFNFECIDAGMEVTIADGKKLRVAGTGIKLTGLDGKRIRMVELLEQTFGVGDAGGIIELRRKWDRIINANWSDLGTLFAQLKQLRNDMNRKMMGLVGKEIVTEHWLCMEVLAQLPSEFWGSTISMTAEWFTIENVKISLRRVFGDRSKKEINMLTEKKRPVMINVAKRFTGKKRSQVDATSAEPGNCFYCFEDGHRKKDCPTMAKDRDPNRPGGALFRSNIRTAPGAKKKRVMAVKKGAIPKKKTTNGSEMTTAEAHVYDQQLAKAIEDADEFAFDENVPVSEGEETGDKVFNPMDIEAEVRKHYGRYLSKLKEFEVTDDLWVVDTGAGHAVSPSRHWFSSLGRGQPHTFEYGNRGTSLSTLQGTVRFSILKPNGYYSNISIKNVAFDKECSSNLFSAYYLATQGYWHIQDKSGQYLYFLDRNNRFVFAAVAIDEVYYLPSKRMGNSTKVLSAKSINTKFIHNAMKEWHLRLGHVGKDRLMSILSSAVIDGAPRLERKDLAKIAFFCRTCALAKSRRMSYRNMIGDKATEPLHTLHMDSLGTVKPLGLYGSAGSKYALAIVDDATAYKWYFVMKSLKEVGAKLTALITQLEKQLPYTVKRIRTDGGSEFLNTVVIKYCTKKGLIFQQSNVESQEENGSAERAHQTVTVPTARLKGKTPYEALYGKKPSGLSLRIWGSTCYAHIPKSKRANQKLSERAVECKLLGLSDNYKGYRLLDIKRNKYLTARDVRFAVTSTAGPIAKSFPSGAVEVSQETINEVCGLGKRKRDVVAQAPAKNSRKENSPLSSMSTETVGDGCANEGVTPIPRPRRKRTTNSRLKDYVVAINTVTRSIKLIPIPRSLKEARRGPHAKQWEEALLVEYRALVKNGTWELVPLPKRPNGTRVSLGL